ncbi:MAG: DUF983 domain-containing protein [Pseudomonadota bacterium]|nr:DUF983 domain-containing protein [Pseudomonadota bacterium]
MGEMEQAGRLEFGGTDRPVLPAVIRGARCRCPACGEGRLFDRMLAVEPECQSCGEVLRHHRADDLPAYLNILLTGHIVVGATMPLMMLTDLSMWTQTSLTALVAVTSAALSMRPLKGMVVGAQWAMRMHGFGGDES